MRLHENSDDDSIHFSPDGKRSGPVRGRFFAVEGDFNRDAVVNATDINLMFAQARAGADAELQYDMTADDLVDRVDVDELVFNALGTRYGDANLDRKFDRLDIQSVLVAGKYGTGESAGFAEGDRDGDGLFSVRDVILVLREGGFEG